jgi:mannose-6-phosphate isomerase-like protein (cupin superfamily)
VSEVSFVVEGLGSKEEQCRFRRRPVPTRWAPTTERLCGSTEGWGSLKATADQTEGRFTIYELRIPRGFGPPLHVHENEDEFFLVLSGKIRLQHRDEVIEGMPGSLAYPSRRRALLPGRLR